HPRTCTPSQVLRARPVAETEGSRDGSSVRRRRAISGVTLVRGNWYRSQGIQDQALPGLRNMATRKRFAVCLRNEGYEASLERRKIYEVIPDFEAAKHDQLRVVDESGEDYLYPENY